MTKTLGLTTLLFSFCVQAADLGAPVAAVAVAAAVPPPNTSRIVGYVAYTECHPIADSPAIFVNTEVSPVEGKFYVAPTPCYDLERLMACNGRRYGIVADVTTAPDWAGFPQRTIYSVVQLGDATTNPACLPASFVLPPRHHRPLR